MYLLLGQLVYTSFAGKGFSILASMQVPAELQQAFIQDVVSRYWDSYNPPKSGYRAVYIHQLTPDQTVFGWLYNDGVDDIGRSHVPLFICYYLAEPLFDFQLENIFTCLHKGPVAVTDRHSHTASLESIAIPDLWSYQPARPGVVVPASVRKSSHVALQQGELLDFFVPVEEQAMAIEMDEQTYEQQIANLSIYTHVVIEGTETSTAVLNKNAATSAIQPYQSNKQKLQRSGQAIDQIQSKYPHGNKRRLKSIPQALSFRNQAVEPISAWLAQHTKAVQRPVVRTKLSQNVSTEQNINPGLWKRFDPTSVNAYKNAQLLLRIGIAATALALLTSICGIFYTNASTSNHLEQSAQTSNSAS